MYFGSLDAFQLFKLSKTAQMFMHMKPLHRGKRNPKHVRTSFVKIIVYTFYY